MELIEKLVKEGKKAWIQEKPKEELIDIANYLAKSTLFSKEHTVKEIRIFLRDFVKENQSDPNMTTIISLEVFTGENWEAYQQQFECFVLLNDIPEGKKVPLLITKLSTKVYDLLITLCTPTSPVNEKYENICEKLKKYYHPVKNYALHQAEFRKRCQKPTENIEQYIVELKKLSKNCKFKNIDEEIKERLLNGTYCDSVKFELLKQADQSLETLTNIGKTVETAYNLTYSQEKQQEQSQMFKVQGRNYTYTRNKNNGFRQDTIPSNKQPTTCYCCGKSGHIRAQCSLREKYCSECGIKGHIFKVCNKKKGLKMKNLNLKEQSDQETKEDEQSEGNCDPDTEVFDIFYFSDKQKIPSATLNVSVNGQVLEFEVDTGADKEGVAQAHAFRSKSFRKPQPCHWCHQPVRAHGSCCRVCKYVCHTTCENKVATAEPGPPAPAPAHANNPDRARFSDTSWQIHRTWRREVDPLPLSPPPRAATAAVPLRSDQNGIYDTITTRAVSAPATPAGAIFAREPSGSRSASFPAPAPAGRLDLCYVAERMLALHLPERDARAETQAAHMLATKHGEHFMVFEVSSGEGGARAARGAFGRARALGWAGALAPPLERLCAACKHIEGWLAAHPRNVAVLLAWGNRERLGVLVAAYMHYSAICGAPEHALDRYAMRRYLDDRVPVFQLPSNKRYIDTFAGLLAGQIRVNAASLQLTHVSVAGALAAPASPAVAFLKIYENLVCVYTSGLYMVSGGGWTVGVGRLALRGDVLVRAYRRPTHAQAERRLVFACQFHTCAVADHTLSFTKQQLDHAAHDPSFPRDGAVELVFLRSEGGGGAAPAPTPAAPLRAAPDAIARADSLENLRPLSTLTDDDPGENNGSASGSGSGGEAGEGAEAAHTFGPLDGSIYATVVRAGGGPASLLSASMDSGISSAGRRAAPSPPDELDALLGDMLRTVSALPDPPAAPVAAQSSADRAPDIPYHARADSAPFTYGAPGLRPGMLRAPNRLASPELVRRALGGDRGYRAIDDDDDERRTSPEPRTPHTPHTPPSPRTLRKLTHEDVTTTTTSTPPPVSPLRNGRWLNGDAEWIDRPSSNARKAIEENGTWRSASTLGWQESSRAREPRRSESALEGSSGLTWLQRQQQKLRERREARERVSRLPLEWDAPSRHVRRSASHRVDGYTSDTTAFADDDDDFSVPLHVNTLRTPLRNDSISPQAPDRTSSKKFMYEKMIMREWSGSNTPTSTTAPGLLSLAEPGSNDTITRERTESWSRSESRAGTPLFPTHPRTPYPPTPTPSLSARPPRSPPVTRKERESSPESEYRTYAGSIGSRRSSAGGAEPAPVAPDRERFARDTSHYWYKPNISRDDAVAALQQLEEGSFIVRDSNSFPGAFGLAVRAGGAGGVRHFLVEPTARGVRLRGCPDEPVFGSLSALVYQHTVTPLALPVPLKLPDRDPWSGGTASAAARALLASGAACHVLLLGSENTEALTGPAAVKRAVTNLIQKKVTGQVVHLKVFGGGVTLTDAARRLFFRRHYPAAAVSYAGLDPDERRYAHVDKGTKNEKRMFAFVARAATGADNQCHVFAELEPEQPATAIVNFINKALLGNSQKKDII